MSAKKRSHGGDYCHGFYRVGEFRPIPLVPPSEILFQGENTWCAAETFRTSLCPGLQPLCYSDLPESTTRRCAGKFTVSVVDGSRVDLGRFRVRRTNGDVLYCWEYSSSSNPWRVQCKSPPSPSKLLLAISSPQQPRYPMLPTICIYPLFCH